MKHIERLRRMVTLAYDIEWIGQDPSRKFKQKLIPTHRGHLTGKELELFEELTLHSLRLRAVKDLFVFSCYTVQEKVFTEGEQEVISNLKGYFDQNPGHYKSYQKWLKEKDSVPNRK